MAAALKIDKPEQPELAKHDASVLGKEELDSRETIQARSSI